MAFRAIRQAPRRALCNVNPTRYQMPLRALPRMSGAKSVERFGTFISDRNDVVQLLEKLYEESARYRVALRQFGEYAMSRGWATCIAIEPHDAPKSVPLRPIVIYTRADVERLLSRVDARGDIRYWALLTTLIESGRRISEKLSLRWNDVKLDVQPHFDLPITKNGRQAYVPLTRQLREDVWAEANISKLRTTGDRRILDRVGAHPFPWRYRTVLDKLRRARQEAGVAYRGYRAFLHTKATELLAKGVRFTPSRRDSAMPGSSQPTAFTTTPRRCRSSITSTEIRPSLS
jgi:integrase